MMFKREECILHSIQSHRWFRELEVATHQSYPEKAKQGEIEYTVHGAGEWFIYDVRVGTLKHGEHEE